MKNILQILVVLFFGTLYLIPSATAQLSKISLSEKIKNSSLIVEGRVCNSQSYFGRAGEIYTNHEVEIWKTLKGSVPTETTVTIVTKGGVVEDLKETWTHQLSLNNDDKGIFFLTHTKYPTNENDRFESPFYEVYSSLQGFLKYHRIYGISVATEPFRTYSNIPELIDRIKGSEIEPSIMNEPDKENCLVYSFDIAEPPNLSTVAIDILAHVTAGNQKLYKSSIVIKYDTSYWGNNIVSNNIVSAVEGVISADDDYSLSLTDFASNIIKLSVNATGSNPELVTLTSQKTQLATLIIPIENLPETLDFDFALEIMEQENEHFDDETGKGQPFRCIKLEDGRLLVDPDISEFSPDTVAAGVRDLSLNVPPLPGKITIYGSGFGEMGVDFDSSELGDDYRVEFKHAAVGPTGNWVSPGVRNDYVYWTDDSIQVYVPSIGEFEGNNDIEQDNYCGTGLFRVVSGKNFLGILRTDLSPGVLTVKYAVKNAVTSSGANPPLVSIRGKILNFFNGGIPFFYNSNFPVAARQDIEWAISEWRCKTGVNMQIHNQADIPASAQTYACEIKWEDLPAGVNTSTGAYVAFTTGATSCFSMGDTMAVHSRHRFNTLTVNKNLNWHMGPDTIQLAFNQKDLRSTLLHEIGHSHYINHSLDDAELMYFSPEQNSDYYRTITEDACLAGLHISSFSTTEVPTINCDGSPAMQQISEEDCQLLFTNSNVNIIESYAAKLYPSPADEYLTLELEKPLSSIATLSVINQLGQRIYLTNLASGSVVRTIDVSTLRPGTYYLLVELPNDKLFTKKFIKI